MRRCSKEQLFAKTREEKREIKGITIFMEPLNNYHPKWGRPFLLYGFISQTLVDFILHINNMEN